MCSTSCAHDLVPLQAFQTTMVPALSWNELAQQEWPTVRLSKWRTLMQAQARTLLCLVGCCVQVLRVTNHHAAQALVFGVPVMLL